MMKVGCEGSDGLIRTHDESETCDVCSTNKRDGEEVELLPLPASYETKPALYNTDDMQAYARANVERALAESRAEVKRLQEQADWCSDALRIEIGQFVGANATLEAVTIRACNDLARYTTRAERLAGALQGITDALASELCVVSGGRAYLPERVMRGALAAAQDTFAALDQEPQE